MDIENKDIKKPEGKDWKLALFLFVRMSGWVGFPVVFSLVVGKFLDKKFGTDPIIFLSLTGLAFVVSVLGILRESKKILEDIK